MADPFQLKHAVLNLGARTRSRRRRPALDSRIETGGRRPVLEVRVRDTGQGHCEDVLPRVFDAFFTTREGGTGLGLPSPGASWRPTGGRSSCAAATGKARWPPSRCRPPRRTLMRTILLVEDHAESRSSLAWVLEKNGYAVRQAPTAARRSPRPAREAARAHPRPEAARHGGRRRPRRRARAAPRPARDRRHRVWHRRHRRRGDEARATDFLTKPIETRASSRPWPGRSSGPVPAVSWRRHVAGHRGDGPLGIIGRSRAMLELFDTVKRLARHQSTTLILGESGTGKELIARAIHALGPGTTARSSR